MEAVKRSDFDLMLGKYLIPGMPQYLALKKVPHTWNVTLPFMYKKKYLIHGMS